MANAKLIVRRVKVNDGEDIDFTDIVIVTDVAEIKHAKLVVVSTSQGNVTYDIYIIYLDGGALIAKYAIKSEMSDGVNINDKQIETLVSDQLASDVHMKDSTNGTVVTNILSVTTTT